MYICVYVYMCMCITSHLWHCKLSVRYMGRFINSLSELQGRHQNTVTVKRKRWTLRTKCLVYTAKDEHHEIMSAHFQNTSGASCYSQANGCQVAEIWQNFQARCVNRICNNAWQRCCVLGTADQCGNHGCGDFLVRKEIGRCRLMPGQSG